MLEREGFSVREQGFTFSEFPGRYGPTAIGLILIAVVWLTSHVHSRHVGAGPAILTLLAGLLVTGAIARWLARRGPLRFPWLRSTSSNLIAMRGQPEVWLVAHSDSKSQTIPMLARIAAILVITIAMTVLGLSLAIAWLISVVYAEGGILDYAVSVSALVAAASAISLVVCFTGNASRGAVDNASGMVSVLLAARELGRVGGVGVLLTSGEELALAGARAFVESNQERTIVLNCDTVDDRGNFICMKHRTTGEAAAALTRAAARLGLPVRERGMIPGILADSIAFADAGWDAITLSRGNLSTLARVHTSSDTPERLDGSGIAQAARLLAATIEELG